MKTVSCIEAIKANREGKRVRHKTDSKWLEPGYFSGNRMVSSEECLSDWEIEDEPLVLWVNVYGEGEFYAYKSKESAEDNYNIDRIKCIKMVECRDE